MKNLTYKFKLGNLEACVISVVNDVTTAGDLVVNATLEELEPTIRKYGFSADQIPTSINNLVIKDDHHTILIDTGIPKPGGNLFAGLEALKIDLSDVDYVVITHSDMDHIGAILDENGDISFPNAKYVMLDEAWQYWQTEESRLALSKLNKWGEDSHKIGWDIYSKIKELMIIPKSGEEFLSGFQLLSAAGHRYDHSVLTVFSAGKQLMHLADTVIHPIFLGNHKWFAKYDANPVQNEETKSQLLNMCAREKMLVFATHFPFPGLGYIQQEGDHWLWTPVENQDN